ncbi:MAG: hypothetical protein OHK0036_09780 [Bacteroidia bacterium]
MQAQHRKYFSDITSVSDYYPFGSPLYGRRWSVGYRYGFNGKENDNEIYGVGNAYDFGDRMYDARLGRWWSVDPEFKKYTYLSPYTSFGNNPVYFIDKKGRTLEPGGNINTALNDIRSLVPKEYQSQIKINDAGKIVFENYSQLPDNVKQFEGVILLNDLINSKNNYLYIAGETISEVRDRTTGKVIGNLSSEKIEKPSFQQAISNLSITKRSDYPENDQANYLPPEGYEGAVRITEGEFYSYAPLIDSYMKVDRSKIVFHELKENYLRTEKGIEDYKIFHFQAGKDGKKFAKELKLSKTGATGDIIIKEGDKDNTNYFKRQTK